MSRLCLRRFLILSSALLVLLCFGAQQVLAEETEKKTRRWEAAFSFETLSPHDIYKDWKQLMLSMYVAPKSGSTYFFQLGAFSRNIGEALLGVVGAYKDWSSRFYTYSALAAGTDSIYLPAFRFDNDFNLKLGAKRSIVWTAGITYLKYHNVHKDFILSSGVTLYLVNWVATYRLFRNRSDPGEITSYSHLLDAAYGREGWQVTNATFSFGKQAYLALYLADPEEVNQRSTYLIVKHRRWIGKGLGLSGDISYFKLQGGYRKIGFTFGVFKEF